jgi:hypothetical protein
MRKTRLLRTTVIALAVLTAAFGMTACGKKNKVTENTTTTTENVSEADKNNEKKPTKVVFDYTDTEGNTVKLEGNATVDDKGEATIEVVDSNGNKTVFTGKANTENGKLSVNDIKVTEGGTLVKTDGTEIKVTEDAKIEDATESTEETKADVAAKEEPKEDVIVADGGNTSEGTGNENAGDNGADNGNVSDTPSNEPVDVPNTPSEPEYVPDVPDVPDNGNDNGSEDTGNTGSNTGNSFYDDFMNGGHMEGDEDLIDKDSDPSKPCPYPLNTPIEGTYTGVNEDGVYGTYPVYIVYNLCSEDETGGFAVELVRNTYYGGKRKVNGIRIEAYISLPIGEYDCGLVRATYVKRV